MAGIKRRNLGTRECAWRPWRGRKERIAFPFSLSRLSLSLSPGYGSTLYPNFLLVLVHAKTPSLDWIHLHQVMRMGLCLFFIAVRVFKELSPDNAQVFFSFTLVN